MKRTEIARIIQGGVPVYNKDGKLIGSAEIKQDGSADLEINDSEALQWIKDNTLAPVSIGYVAQVQEAKKKSVQTLLKKLMMWASAGARNAYNPIITIQNLFHAHGSHIAGRPEDISYFGDFWDAQRWSGLKEVKGGYRSRTPWRKAARHD